MIEAGTRLLVTGAASGIGRAVVALAHRLGARVVAADRDVPRLTELADTLGVGIAPLDVTDEASVDACFTAAAEALGGPVATVVHAAGRYEIEPAVSLDLAAWNRVLAVNATGSFLVARAFGRQVIGTGTPGALVLISSIAADHGDDAEPAGHYSASKAAIEALTRQLAVEWGPHRIRVNCVSPGLIRTPMLRITDDPERASRTLTEVVPLRRLGEPEEVAAACLFLAGPHASYISGATLTIDGGLTAR